MCLTSFYANSGIPTFPSYLPRTLQKKMESKVDTEVSDSLYGLKLTVWYEMADGINDKEHFISMELMKLFCGYPWPRNPF